MAARPVSYDIALPLIVIAAVIFLGFGYIGIVVALSAGHGCQERRRRHDGTTLTRRERRALKRMEAAESPGQHESGSGNE